MVKVILKFVLGLFFILLLGCSSQDQSPTIIDETLFFLNENQQLKDEIKVKFPTWIKNDLECYSFVKIKNDKGNLSAYPIHCKILAVLRGGVKCRILETTSYFAEIKCKKYDVKSGFVWYEKEGELFKTKQEAIEAIQKKGYYLISSIDNHLLNIK